MTREEVRPERRLNETLELPKDENVASARKRERNGSPKFKALEKSPRIFPNSGTFRIYPARTITRF